MKMTKTYGRPAIKVVTVEYDKELLFSSGQEGSIPYGKAKAATFYDDENVNYDKE